MPKQVDFDFSMAKPYSPDLSGKKPFVGISKTHPPQTAYFYDMHYELEIGIVLKGETNFLFHGFESKLYAGNLWFCGMWEPHGYAVGNSPYEEVNLVIWPPALADLRFDESARFDWLAPFTAPPNRRPQTTGKSQRAMQELGLKIKERLQKKETTWEWLRLHVMEAILLATEGWAGAKLSNPAQIESVGRLNQLLQQFFDKHGRMTTLEASQTCGLSRNAFGKMFHGLMGLAFADFVMRYRLDAAASCLRQTGESVKNIALEWGFTDTSHFDRLFVKYYACTPREYRQKRSAFACDLSAHGESMRKGAKKKRFFRVRRPKAATLPFSRTALQRAGVVAVR
ncbi:MAG: AraC family transcriptional regulator [Kiritimatiellia bacterium]